MQKFIWTLRVLARVLIGGAVVVATSLTLALPASARPDPGDPPQPRSRAIVVSDGASRRPFMVYDKKKCRGHSAPVYAGKEGPWRDDRSVKIKKGRGHAEIFSRATGRKLKDKVLKKGKCYNTGANTYWVVVTR